MGLIKYSIDRSHQNQEESWTITPASLLLYFEAPTALLRDSPYGPCRQEQYGCLH